MQTITTQIIIENNVLNTKIDNYFDQNNYSDTLFLKIKNSTLKGKSFDDFCISIDEISELNEFNFNIFKKNAYLCNCVIKCIIFLPLYDKNDKYFKDLSINFSLYLGKPTPNGGLTYEYAEFEFIIDKNIDKIKADDFEIALLGVQNKIEPMNLKTCVFCKYSSFHPAGQGFFGTLFCFKNYMQDFLNHKTKQELFDLIKEKSLPTQEIWVCDKFEKKI